MVSASCSYLGKSPNIKLWNVQPPKELHSISPHDQWLLDVRFSPDGKSVTSRGDNAKGRGSLKFWDSRTGKFVRTLEAKKYDFKKFAIRHDGNVIASAGYVKPASYDNAIRIWDFKTAATRFIKPGHAGGFDEFA